MAPLNKLLRQETICYVKRLSVLMPRTVYLQGKQPEVVACVPALQVPIAYVDDWARMYSSMLPRRDILPEWSQGNVWGHRAGGSRHS